MGDPNFCATAVSNTIKSFDKIDILVNNAAEQHPKKSLEAVSAEQLQHTFRTNFFGYFYLTHATLPKLKKGGVIINTSSVTAYRGSANLIDYASTKGAIVAFTRSLAESLAERGIRVNGVAPGPIWTPLIPATFDKDKVESFGADTLLKRAGQPCEVASCYVFLASQDGSYFTGQILHPNGGGFVST
jgi:NAD(P)-dependent dehydrogenase (short-subunit alcohol dehydrogenase family)